jgi:hypothetical protein
MRVVTTAPGAAPAAVLGAVLAATAVARIRINIIRPERLSPHPPKRRPRVTAAISVWI